MELKEKYSEQEKVLDYLEDNFFPLRRLLVNAWANNHPHYGVRTTSACEGSHAELKSFLYTSTGDLEYVASKFELWV